MEEHNPSLHTEISDSKQTDIGQSSVDAVRQRILAALKSKKRTKAWLAAEMGLSKQRLNYLLNHASRIKPIAQLAETLNINPDWLVQGEGPINLYNNPQAHYRKIPLLHWPAHSNPDFITKAQEQEQSACIIGEASLPEHCFALTLHNKSMEPQFDPGTILIFDPNRQAQHQDFVLAYIINEQSLIFRQHLNYNHTTNTQQPASLVSAHQHETIHALDSPFKVQGVLIQTRYNYT